MTKDMEPFCSALVEIQSEITKQRFLILRSIEQYDELLVAEKLLLRVIKRHGLNRKPAKLSNVIRLVAKDGK